MVTLMPLMTCGAGFKLSIYSQRMVQSWSGLQVWILKPHRCPKISGIKWFKLNPDLYHTSIIVYHCDIIRELSLRESTQLQYHGTVTKPIFNWNDPDNLGMDRCRWHNVKYFYPFSFKHINVKGFSWNLSSWVSWSFKGNRFKMFYYYSNIPVQKRFLVCVLIKNWFANSGTVHQAHLNSIRFCHIILTTMELREMSLCTWLVRWWCFSCK